MAPPISASEVAALVDKWNAKRDANFVNILKELPANIGDKLESNSFFHLYIQRHHINKPRRV